MWSCSPLLPGSVTNEEAWQHGRLLVVGTQQYIIELNPPIVEKVFHLVGMTSSASSMVTAVLYHNLAAGILTMLVSSITTC